MKTIDNPRIGKSNPSQLTRSKVIALRNKYPCMTQTVIAKQLNISIVRVGQILMSENLPTRKWVKEYICNQCGKLILGDGKLFCSRECRHLWIQSNRYIELKCDYCGTIFKRYLPEALKYLAAPGHYKISYEHKFCDRYCLISWLGENFGFNHRLYDIGRIPIYFKEDSK